VLVARSTDTAQHGALVGLLIIFKSKVAGDGCNLIFGWSGGGGAVASNHSKQACTCLTFTSRIKLSSLIIISALILSCLLSGTSAVTLLSVMHVVMNGFWPDIACLPNATRTGCAYMYVLERA
jgi:hypothetical protein